MGLIDSAEHVHVGALTNPENAGPDSSKNNADYGANIHVSFAPVGNHQDIAQYVEKTGEDELRFELQREWGREGVH